MHYSFITVSYTHLIPLGSIAAFNRGKWADNVVIFIATCGIAVPSFVICSLA